MSSTDMQEHELVTYSRVQDRIEWLRKGIRIKTRGPLITALEKLSCVPFVSFYVEYGTSSKIRIAGQKAGSLNKPDIDLILKHSKQSPFGRGSETVTDETYRRGREIVADKIDLKSDYSYNSFESEIAQVVKAMLFVPSRIELKLYKLAVYTKGGHFDWHMDTTHSDRHHATVLVALCTNWTGGDLILRRNGVETRIDMKPKTTKPRYSKRQTVLAVVAFYTDTEHKVEPVTDGVRIVLQYDVEVENWSGKGETTVKSAQESKEEATDGAKKSDDNDEADGDDESYDEDEDMSEEEEDDDDMDVDPSEGSLSGIQDVYQTRQPHENIVSMSDPAFADEVANIVGKLLKSGHHEVSFALQYLYRKSSILPEYLKGSDSLLYQTLAKTFDVSLHPIVLHEATDYEGNYGGIDATFLAYKYEPARDVPRQGVKYEDIKHPKFLIYESEDVDHGKEEEIKDDDEGKDTNKDDEGKDIDKDDDDEGSSEDDGDDDMDEDDNDDDMDEDDNDDDKDSQTKKLKAIFYIPRSSAVERISHQSYVEYTGNEAMLGENKYFGGGMFVRRKDAPLDDKSV